MMPDGPSVEVGSDFERLVQLQNSVSLILYQAASNSKYSKGL